MASFSSSPSLLANPDSGLSLFKRSSKIKMLRRTTAAPLSITAASLNDDDNQHSSTKLLTFLGKGGSGKTTSAVFAAQSNEDNFEIIIYDGVSSDETLRMIGAASKARLYLKYLRNFAEKTDLGRLAGPSLLRLVDEALSLSGSKYNLNGKMSTEMWDSLERILEVKYRGGSELVAEAGDQRRVICLPTKIQGKVGGAKFVDRSLVITVRRWDFNGYQLLFAFFHSCLPKIEADLL
ncbi:hypothetical protein NC651_020428 [Populus alba x Populus x berolinensis]|nr:hypothetical protein NC651_020428 [Populus alba x Populus x berolinensis]